MHVLRTGLQGNGKTLNTIKEVDAKAAKENRVVYYHNIREFNPDHQALKGEWIEFDTPLEWFNLPQNSLIVIDEAQTFFRVRRQGSPVPEYASALETMRHRGHELHSITQNPGLIDTHFRKLTNSHIHYVRGHKGKVIKRWEFERVNMDVEKHETFSSGESQRLLIDQTYFGVYKSVADGSEHHFRFRPPRALYVFLACVLLLGLAVWRIYESRFAKPEPQVVAAAAPQAQSFAAATLPASSEPAPITREQYLELHTPRFADVPSSAPIFDQITQPVSFPKPVCVATYNQQLLERNSRRFTVGVHQGKFGGCFCNSQQGTKIAMSFEACIDIVENGYFDATKPERDQSQQGTAAADSDGGAGRAGAAEPVAAVEKRRSSVVVVADSSRDSRPLTPVR
jgi:zona occludens toxin